jgi:hypothetical protein
VEPPKAEPLPGMKVVAEPSLKEQMDDDIPFNDSPDPNVTVDKSGDKSVLTAHLKKSVEKPTINKRGVQKIAGGRGR